MKKVKQLLLAVSLIALLGFAGESTAGVSVFVKISPPKVKRVHVVRPAKPYRTAIWVNGHYKYRHGRYIWTGGYWVKKKPGYVYVQPHWKKTRHGYRFVTGRWVLQ